MSVPANQVPIPISASSLDGFAELGEPIRAFAEAIPIPDAGQTWDSQAWLSQLHTRLAQLRAAFVQHCAATGGPEGYYSEVVLDAPRLARTAQDLIAEHTRLDALLTALAHRIAGTNSHLGSADQVAVIRRQSAEIVADLTRHRQQIADLVHEAYATDLGSGE